MPKYTPGEDDMDASYSEPVTAPESSPKPAESVDEENSGADEMLMEKSKLPSGCKVGDSYTFKVTKDFGDEVSLALVSEGSEDTETGEPESVEAGELAALSNEGE